VAWLIYGFWGCGGDFCEGGGWMDGWMDSVEMWEEVWWMQLLLFFINVFS
jgi:hypothetical protein